MTLPETLQDYFNIAWRHAVVEKQPPATDGYGKCMYRGKNGRRCLIGAAIPDDKYKPSIEGRPADWALQMVGMLPEENKDYKDSQLCMDLCRLQGCHDQIVLLGDITKYSDHIKIKLQDFATEYNLTIPS